MITVEAHLERILGTVAPLPPVVLPLTHAQGCILAADVLARVGLPGFDNSAMDGYAVHFDDVAELAHVAGGGSPTEDRRVVLPVVDDIAAGDRRQLSQPPGTAYRIMTGAPVPAGADTVVPVELTDGGTDEVAITEVPARGAHIRRAQEDVRTGDVVLRAGTRLGPRQLAAAAAVGHGEVSVHPRPRVVCFSTGDELVPPGTVPGFGQVVDSNSLMLVTALREAGFDAEQATAVEDAPEAVLEALGSRLEHADALITTGGVSMGAYDAVKAALSRLGTVRFDKVAMQPGKPQGFGTLGERAVPVFTLPGNPVSALVSFEVFVAPALRVLAGRPAKEARYRTARVADGWRSPAGKVQFVRGVLGPDADGSGRLSVRSAGGQGSHMLASLVAADTLVVVPAEADRVEVGDLLECRPLGLPGGAW